MSATVLPPLSIIGIRTALVTLLVGSTIGTGLLIAKSYAPQWLGSVWLRAHMEIMMFGWMTQFAFGVAYWILPRLPNKAGRGRPRFAAMAFILLNIGVLLAAFVAGPAGHILIAMAVASFAIHAFPRVTRPLVSAGHD